MASEAHAKLGASGAHRWMVCAGSIQMEEPYPDVETEYAAEGTAAHDLAEKCLLKPNVHPSTQWNAEAGHTEDMVKPVAVYVDYVRSRPGVLTVEQKFSLEALNPPAPMFGTADAVLWDEETRTLEVCDLKYGQGVVVNAMEYHGEEEDGEGGMQPVFKPNPQLMYYALGAILAKRVRPDTIRLTIVQPRGRSKEGPIRSIEVTMDEMIAFRKELLEAAHRAMAEDAPVGPAGAHCKFCKAKAACPAQAEAALALVGGEFEALAEAPEAEEFGALEEAPTPAEAESNAAVQTSQGELTPVDALTQQQILAILDRADDIVSYVKAVQSHVHGQLEQGVAVPGYKLVAKRATRRWKDLEEAEAWFRQRFKVDEVYTRKLISPAQAEKLTEGRTRLANQLEDMIEATSSGTNLAPADDPRPAVIKGEEFDLIEGGTTDGG